MTSSVLGIDTQTGQRVEIPKSSRLQGLYIIGIQGTGKSGLIENLIIQDIKQQIGVCVLDPHGELIEHIIARLPGKAEEDRVIFLDLANYSCPFGLNLFECPDPTDDGEIVQTIYQVLHVFEKAYGITPTTPLMYDLLYNTAYALIANPGYSLIDIRLLLTNEACRKKLVANVPNPDVSSFWTIWDDPRQTPPREQEEKRGAILNKLNDFSHVPLRNIVGQSKTTINLQNIMDTGKILLVKLSRRLEQPSNLIGSIIVAQLLNAAYARPANKRKQFHLYADEFQNFATEDFATLLEEARKFGIATTIAHQNRGQLNSANSRLETDLKDRSRSVGNLVLFRVNSKDADELAGQFQRTPPPPEIEWIEREEGDEPIKVYKRQIIDQLLKQGHVDTKGHEDERVMQFVNAYLQPLASSTKRNASYWSDGKYYTPDQALADLNTWLYEGMVNLDRLFRPLPKTVIDLLKISSLYINLLGVEEYSAFWDCLYVSDESMSVWSKTEGMRFEYDRVTEQLRYTVQTLLPQQAEDFYRLRRTLFSQPEFISAYQDAVIERAAYLVAGAVDAEFDNWQDVVKDRGWPYVEQRLINEYKLEPGLSQQEFAQAVTVGMQVKHYMEIERRIKESYSSFERFFESAQLCQYALWQNPLWTTESSLYRPRKHQHPIITQRSYPEMESLIANELTNLPLYTARVKITTQAGLEEHTIRTLDPKQQSESPLFGQALQARHDSIKKQNIQDGYLRERADVEEEIRQRQAQCSQPLEEEPPISRRPPR